MSILLFLPPVIGEGVTATPGVDFSVTFLDVQRANTRQYTSGELVSVYCTIRNLGNVSIGEYDLESTWMIRSSKGLIVYSKTDFGTVGSKLQVGGIKGICNRSGDGWTVTKNAEAGWYTVTVSILHKPTNISRRVEKPNAFQIIQVTTIYDIRVSTTPLSAQKTGALIKIVSEVIAGDRNVRMPAGTFSIEATEPPGWRFLRWYVTDLLSVGAHDSIMTSLKVSGTGAIFADFGPIVNYRTSPPNAGSITIDYHGCNPRRELVYVDGKSDAVLGCSSDIVASPAPGFGFDRWSFSGEVSVLDASSARTPWVAGGPGGVEAIFLPVEDRIIPRQIYSASIQVLGLPTAVTSEVRVDDGSILELASNKPTRLTYSLGESHELRPEAIVYTSTNVRYVVDTTARRISQDSDIIFSYSPEYSLIVETDPPGLKTVGTAWYKAGEIAKFAIEQVDGNVFSYWYLNGDARRVYSTKSSDSIFMDKPYTLTAKVVPGPKQLSNYDIVWETINSLFTATNVILGFVASLIAVFSYLAGKRRQARGRLKEAVV
jgi:hypothetical protein